MDSAITEYQVKGVTDEVVDEIDSLLIADEVSAGMEQTPASRLLSCIETIEWLREIGVSGDFSVTCGDFYITFPEE